jgi:hypothetical protein
MKLGNHSVPGIKGVSEHCYGFLIQCDPDGLWRTCLKATSRLRCPWHPFVDPLRHFASYEKCVAAVPEMAPGSREYNDPASPLFALVERA